MVCEKEFFGSTTVGERGQVVIPSEARDSLKLEKGDKLLVFGLHKECVMLTKLSSFKRMSNELEKKQKEIKKILENN